MTVDKPPTTRQLVENTNLKVKRLADDVAGMRRACENLASERDDAQARFNHAITENEWLRQQLVAVLGRITGLEAVPHSEFDQLGNRIR